MPNAKLGLDLKYWCQKNIVLFSVWDDFVKWVAATPQYNINIGSVHPDTNRPIVPWLDLDALTGKYSEDDQIVYPNVLAFSRSTQKGSPYGYLLARSIDLEPDAARKAFYKQFMPKNTQVVPYFRQLSGYPSEFALPNLPPSTFDQADKAMGAWAKTCPTPYPCVALEPDNVLFPDVFATQRVVSITAWREAFDTQVGGGGFTEDDRAKLNDIWTKLQGPVVG